VLIFGILVMNADLIAQGERPNNYVQPNSTAGIAGCALIALLTSRRLWRWRWTDRLLWPAGLICAAGLLVARSRSALIATLLVVLPLLWSMRGGNLAVVAAAAASFVTLAWPYSQTVSHLPQTIESYLMRSQKMEDAMTVSGRTELWDIAIPSFLESPLFGHGYFSVTSTGTMHVWGAERWQTAHNIYLHVLTGTGLIGFFLLAWALFFALRPLSQHLHKHAPMHKLAFLVFLLLAWYLALGFFELSFAGPVDPEVVLFFLLLGIAAGQTTTAKPAGRRG
jgi:O-antigen ligase